MDRSAAYAARWVAKNVVAAGLARRCTIQLAYAIGDVEHPVYVDTHGTEAVAPETVDKRFGDVRSLPENSADLNLLSICPRPTEGRPTSPGGNLPSDALKAAINKKVGKAA